MNEARAQQAWSRNCLTGRERNPVWPEFAQAGKERITVQHAAEPGPLAALTNAERAALHDYAVRVLAAAMPGAWSPDKA